ncbi:MAG TPA: M24 family metallopeptidase [Gemmatimonadaceae bacterium]|nr:M24 family metallopeptidase [Gemmatimonadaceae bacterium]
MLNPQTLPAIQRALGEMNVDGWLLFDFHGLNPVATGMLGMEGLLTRRIFALVPREGIPVAISHTIEQAPWKRWPSEWPKQQYSSWRALEEQLGKLVKGKTVAMEYSPGDAVPYLDRVPAGVLEMVKAAGAKVISSGELVTRFYASWAPAHVESHRRAAVAIAQIAKDAINVAGKRAKGGAPLAEHELAKWIMDRFAEQKLFCDHGPIVAAGANAANPHYEPSASSARSINKGDILLVDLWAREPTPDGVYADQTWMASLGKPSARALEVWDAVRDARDAAIKLVVDRVGKREEVRGGEVDDAARTVIRDRGFGEYFTHRTGHSIDPRDLHGSGPHLDNLETREERLLIPGVAFSIEPGIYISGEIGMRTEVNVYVTADRAVVTPDTYQRDLIIAG